MPATNTLVMEFEVFDEASAPRALQKFLIVVPLININSSLECVVDWADYKEAS